MRRVDCHHRHWRNLCPRTRTKQLTRHGTITNRRHRAQESTGQAQSAIAPATSVRLRIRQGLRDISDFGEYQCGARSGAFL
jgi:hypothetical protein